jgi:cytoskeletal protein CcmA (bactofilin family)
MLQSPIRSESSPGARELQFSSAALAVEPATIGASVVIKGKVSGAEDLFIDGSVEGAIDFPSHRVTVGRSGQVTADITARHAVIMGAVMGNIVVRTCWTSAPTARSAATM